MQSVVQLARPAVTIISQNEIHLYETTGTLCDWKVRRYQTICLFTTIKSIAKPLLMLATLGLGVLSCMAPHAFTLICATGYIAASLLALIVVDRIAIYFLKYPSISYDDYLFHRINACSAAPAEAIQFVNSMSEPFKLQHTQEIQSVERAYTTYLIEHINACLHESPLQLDRARELASYIPSETEKVTQLQKISTEYAPPQSEPHPEGESLHTPDTPNSQTTFNVQVIPPSPKQQSNGSNSDSPSLTTGSSFSTSPPRNPKEPSSEDLLPYPPSGADSGTSTHPVPPDPTQLQPPNDEEFIKKIDNYLGKPSPDTDAADLTVVWQLKSPNKKAHQSLRLHCIKKTKTFIKKCITRPIDKNLIDEPELIQSLIPLFITTTFKDKTLNPALEEIIDECNLLIFQHMFKKTWSQDTKEDTYYIFSKCCQDISKTIKQTQALKKIDTIINEKLEAIFNEESITTLELDKAGQIALSGSDSLQCKWLPSIDKLLKEAGAEESEERLSTEENKTEYNSPSQTNLLSPLRAPLSLSLIPSPARKLATLVNSSVLKKAAQILLTPKRARAAHEQREQVTQPRLKNKQARPNKQTTPKEKVYK